MNVPIKTIETFANTNATNVVKLLGGETDLSATLTGWLPQGVKFNRHQISIEAGDNSSGTITVTATIDGRDDAQTVFEDDGTTAMVINLATSGEPFTRTGITAVGAISFSFAFSTLGGSDDVTITVHSYND